MTPLNVYVYTKHNGPTDDHPEAVLYKQRFVVAAAAAAVDGDGAL